MEASGDHTAKAFSDLSMDSSAFSTAEPAAGDGAAPLSKNAAKRELKIKQKEEKAKQAPKASSQNVKSVAADDEDMDPTQYFENRLKYLAAEKDKGENPYPPQVFHVDVNL